MTSIIHGMPAAKYHAAKGLSATAIKQGRISPRHMRQYLVGPPRDETPAMRWGKLLHAAVLEPAVFSENVTVFDGRRAGKAWDEHVEEHGAEWTIKQDEMGKLLTCSARVHAHPQAGELLADVQTEVSVF